MKPINHSSITFLNPKTCGIYKNGSSRYKTDHVTGQRTSEIDNELLEAVESYLVGKPAFGESQISNEEVFKNGIMVPTYYDRTYNEGIERLLKKLNLKGITLGELADNNILKVRTGHGSPGNDQRKGHIPYIKVSDIRALRVNVNPTNLVSDSVARKFWRGETSGLKSWDLITPNRASSNIGEFAVLLPGEENVLITKEVFIFSVLDLSVWDPFYLLWALSLRVVRDQWKRITLMQTNREDSGSRYREIILPVPTSKEWAMQKSSAFRDYFTIVSKAKENFIEQLGHDEFDYIASVAALGSLQEE